MAPLCRSKRLKLMTSDSAAFSSARRNWLDLLSPDICTHIASYVSRGTPHCDLLHLSQVSPFQSSAVTSVLSNKLQLSEYSTSSSWSVGELSHWVQLVAPSLTELRLLDCPRDLRVRRDMLKAVSGLLVTAPQLRKATLPNEPALLAALSKVPNLEELTVCVQHEGQFHPWVSALWRKKTTLSITKLILECRVSMSCPFRIVSNQSSLAVAITASCPSLSSFELVCSCPCSSSPTPTQRLLSLLPSLRGTRIRGELSPGALAKLHDMESVCVQYSDFSYSQAVALGATVTSLTWTGIHALEPGSFLDTGQVAALAGCTRMEKLCLSLQGGAESALADVVRQMPALRVLRVITEPSVECGHMLRRNDEVYGEGQHVMCFQDATREAFLTAVKAAPRLTELHLLDVRVAADELIDMLRSVGERLEAFSTSICGQEDGPFYRLEKLLHAAVKYNSSIRKFCCGPIDVDVIDYDGKDLIELRRRMKIAIRRLEQAAPFFDAEPLRWICYFFWYRFLDMYSSEDEEA